MASQRKIVTLLTDFGTADGYVGEVKGTILSRVPDVMIVDIAHDLAPQDIEGARLALARYWRRFPEGTVHVVVVDPGVGTGRAAIAVASASLFLVGPDNGVLSPALLDPDAHAVSLPIPRQASATFHGRDLFAPVAASLLQGVRLADLGPPHASPVVRRTPEAHRRSDGDLQGEVITIDRFGNAVTNCLGVHGHEIEVAGLTLPLVHTYGDAAPGALVALIGSTGLVEIAERNGSAARRLGLRPGTPVVIRRGG